MSKEFPIKNFLGVNLKDAADRVKDNELTLAQNAWQPTKGVLARRFGSVIDQSAFALASRVSGVWRHYSSTGDRFTIYHCVPNSTPIPDNSVDLTLAEVIDGNGNLFAGGAVVTLRVCYSWIGRGAEQTYNSRTRAGFPVPGTFPINASANPAHQTITLAHNDSRLRVTIPAFPTGITGANIFLARGTVTEMNYVGTISTSAGNLLLSEFVGLHAAAADALVLVNTPSGVFVNGGTLKPGSYWVAAAWVADSNKKEGSGSVATLPLSSITQVNVTTGQNAIQVTAPAAASTNGAQAVYVFVGTQDPHLHPLTCVGLIRADGSAFNFLDITSIPSHNAQTSPVMISADVSVPVFWNMVNDQYIGGFNVGWLPFQARFGFLMASQNGGAIKEVFPSRTLIAMMIIYGKLSIYAGDVGPENLQSTDLHNYAPQPKTQNDMYQSVVAANGFNQPYVWNRPVTDPMFCYQLGISYFANGVDIPWQTDGFTLSQMGVAQTSDSTKQTQLPPIPRFLFVYQNSLIAAGSDNQLYGSNAFSPQNWATGGINKLLRFVTIGDAVGSGVTATGAFTPMSEATSNPGSFLIAFKKVGTWMTSGIGDPVVNTIAGNIGGQTPSPMTQVSGKTGCVAYRSIVQTPIGTIFLGSDANVYLINRVAEPGRIGTKIQNALLHLVGNDDAMKSVTAVHHDRHYKLSYPSPAAVTAGLAGSPYVNDMEWWADLRTTEGDPITWFGPHIGRNIGPQVVLSGDGDDFSRLVADSALVRTFTADSIASLSDLAANGSAQAIAEKVTSKIYRFGADAHLKRIAGAILDLYIDYSYTNNVLFEGFADEFYQQINRRLSTGGGVWDSSQWDQTGYADALWAGFSYLFGPDNLSGRTFQWSFSSSDQAPLVLAGVTLLVKPEKRRVIR